MENWKRFLKEGDVNHDEILKKAEGEAKSEDDVPRIETLHQNVAHMTVALKELEGRRVRVANKHKMPVDVYLFSLIVDRRLNHETRNIPRPFFFAIDHRLGRTNSDTTSQYSLGDRPICLENLPRS